MANRSEFLKPRRGSNSSDEGLLPFSEEPVDAEHSSSCTSEAQCSECDFYNPAAVVKCEGCDKWFCNVYGKSGNSSHIVKHLAGSGHFQVALHPRNLLGSSFAIECSVCHSKNVFNLLCSNNLTLACTLHTLGDASWQPLIKDEHFLNLVVGTSSPTTKGLTSFPDEETVQPILASAESLLMSNAALQRLKIAAIFAFVFMIGEFIGGIFSNSLAVLADSAHMLVDVFGLLIAIFAVYMCRRQATDTASFGYHRVEVLGALASTMIVCTVALTLVVNAIKRIIHPPDIVASIMLITASCGIVINIVLVSIMFSYFRLIHQKKESVSGKSTAPPNILNMKSAMIPMLGDFIQSIGLLVAAIIIFCKPEWKIADPISTVIFSSTTICLTTPVIKECIHILLEKTPTNINIKDLSSSLQNVPGVVEVHDLHVWSLNSGKVSLSCHLKSSTPFDSLKEATRICKQLYSIAFVTIQVEEIKNESKGIDFTITLQ